MTPKAKAPKHLQTTTKKWWISVVTKWDLDPHHTMLLTLSGEAWDRGQQARRLVEEEGMTVKTRDGGLKSHPAIRVETDCRLAFARLIRELDLDVESPKEASRPPSLRSIG